MERKEAIRGAYRLTGGNNFYDGIPKTNIGCGLLLSAREHDQKILRIKLLLTMLIRPNIVENH